MKIVDLRNTYPGRVSVFPFLPPDTPNHQLTFPPEITVRTTGVRPTVGIDFTFHGLTVAEAEQLRDALSTAIQIAETGETPKEGE